MCLMWTVNTCDNRNIGNEAIGEGMVEMYAEQSKPKKIWLKKKRKDSK